MSSFQDREKGNSCPQLLEGRHQKVATRKEKEAALQTTALDESYPGQPMVKPKTAFTWLTEVINISHLVK